MVPRGKDGGRDSQGVWDGLGHTAVFDMENLLSLGTLLRPQLRKLSGKQYTLELIQ